MIDVTTDGLTLSGTVGWAALLTYATLLGTLAFSLLMLRRGGIDLRAALAPVQERMGLAELPTTLFLIAGLLWGGLLIILTLGLYALVLEVLWQSVPKAGETSAAWDWRFKLVQITALTGVLGVVVALPFTLVRIGLTRAQNATAAESLFNDKINAATEDLYAQRQVSEGERDIWQDDVIKRNAAIDRLEGLAEERPDTAPRIARMLSVYVRELSREYPAKVPPEDASPEELSKWARNLKLARSDMEKAVQTLGRMRDTSGRAVAEVPIDLRGANLQGFDLKHLDFQQAEMSEAQLQGADLREAQLQGAVLPGAQLQGALLIEAQLQGANLGGAELQGANLVGARLQGADLDGAAFDASTSLSAATLRGAALREVDCTTIPFSQEQIEEAFGDASVILGDLKKPTHWDPGQAPLDWVEFREKWRAHLRSIGMDPENPA